MDPIPGTSNQSNDLHKKRNLIEFNIQTTTSESVPFTSTKSVGIVVIEDTLSLFVIYVFSFEANYCQEIRLCILQFYMQQKNFITITTKLIVK